ncbi:hypothetical protein QJQ45_004084 [Haematococcus lacustris]|nr:hypothetical protein QJQ45_004084 [Haematococcus lacustris]
MSTKARRSRRSGQSSCWANATSVAVAADVEDGLRSQRPTQLAHRLCTTYVSYAMCNYPSILLDPTQRLARLKEDNDRSAAMAGTRLEEDMAEVSMERHGHAKQLVASSVPNMGLAAEPTQPTKAAKAKPAPQPGRWLDKDCNAALNMQRIAESRWRPLKLCYWPDQGALPAKGKEYPGLGYKRLRDKPPKAQQQQQQQPSAAQYCVPPFVELISADNQRMFCHANAAH